ncbi:MAG: hypothetical protein HRT35_32935, partial [Algicola sp.]|nr:hypothetical protein [Algicola sp.]
QDKTALLSSAANDAFNTQTNDLLLAALANTVSSQYGAGALSVTLEGHGREQFTREGAEADIDLSRTVGWFTTLYPVHMNFTGFNHGADDWQKLIINTKEHLRNVPLKGLGYGVLKYINKAFETPLHQRVPEMAFNYLGEIDGGFAQQNGFAMVDKAFSLDVSADRVQDHKLSFEVFVKAGRLTVLLHYRDSVFNNVQANDLLGVYRSQLLGMIDFCTTVDEAVVTPADLTIGDMTMDDLEGLFDDV